MSQSTFNVIDLFSGIGGFSRGFEMAGFNIKLGIDNWDVALRTFKRNHKNAAIELADLTNLKPDYYKNLGYKVDVIIAGPPCQGFSMAGKREEDDIRNKLFNEVIRAAKYTKPRVVIIENVVGLNSMKDINGNLVKDSIVSKLENLGYKVKSQILIASDYGVPQNRRRVLFVGYKGKNEFDFPKQHNQKVTVGDALGNIPDVNSLKYKAPKTNFQIIMGSKNNENIQNHVTMKHSSDVIRRFKHVPEGGNWKDIPEKYYGVGGTHSNNYRKLDRNKPSITIKHASKSMINHPIYSRVITVREAARLQSFPDDFVLEGTNFEQHQQLANAVPPLLGLAIADSVKRLLNEEI